MEGGDEMNMQITSSKIVISLLVLAIMLFFNAGLGIIALSYLTLAGYTDINAMNGLKLLIASTVSIVAIALFIHDGVIAWYAGTVLLLGTLAGGYFAANLSRRLPQQVVRRFVVIASSAITVYFFYDTYFSA